MSLTLRRCLGRHVSAKIYPIRKYKYRVYIAPSPVRLRKAVGLFPRGSFKSKSTYKRGVAFSSPSNELQGAFRVNTWEFLTTYSQRKLGEVDKIICCLFTLRHFLFFFVLVIVAHMLQAMGDKRSGRHLPEDDTSPPPSTSGTGKSQSRYKPLAPKGPLGGESQSLNLATFVP